METNLKIHRDGSTQLTKSGNPGCKNRQAAIDHGANLPPTEAELRLLCSMEINEDVSLPPNTLAALSQWATFDNDVLNQMMVLWLLRQAQPWSRIEDIDLRACFCYANKQAQLKGCTWAAQQGHEVYLSLHDEVFQKLKNNTSMFNLQHDSWTSKGNRYAFLGFAVSYIDENWKFIDHHLGLKLIAWYHKGEWLSEPLVNILRKNQLYPKMLSQTTDSGSNNNTMAVAMDNSLSRISVEENQPYHWEPKSMHVYCLAHKCSLIVNSGLDVLGLETPPPPLVKKFSRGRFPLETHLQTITEECEDEECTEPQASNSNQSSLHPQIQQDDLETEHDETDADAIQAELDFQKDKAEFSGNNDDDEIDTQQQIQQMEEAEENFDVFQSQQTHRRNSNNLANILKQLDFVIQKLSGSAAMRMLFKMTMTSLDLSLLMLIAGYGIRWHIKWQSRRRAWYARKVIEEILRRDQSDPPPLNQDGGTSDPSAHYPRGIFKKIMFKPDDWKQIRELDLELERYTLLTKRMEDAGPTGSMVIYEYVKLKRHLQKKINQSLSTDALYPMYEAMLQHVNKYLEEALRCKTLVMATLLHPSWRLPFFHEAFGATSMHSIKAEDLLKTEFRSRKIKLNNEITDPVPPASGQSTQQYPDSEDELLHIHDLKRVQTITDEISVWNLANDAPETDVALNPTKALEWWKANSSRYPILSSLARDYLATSGSSCAIERAFSAAADVCGRNRGALLPRTIERCVCCMIWLQKKIKPGGVYELASNMLNVCTEEDKAARHKN